MAFQNHANVPPNIRHRIQDITIQPTISESPIKLEVLVDGQNVHKLSTIKPSQTLRWDMQTYPCDVHQGSTIGLKLIEKHHTSPDRELLIEYTVSEAVNQSVVTKHAGAFPSQWPAFGLVAKRPNTASATTPLVVTVKLLDLSQITSNYSNAFDRATTMVEETQGPLDKLGNSRETLKTILGFGAVVSELHPIAKLVIGLCTRAWELLEKIQKQHEDLERLINGLTQMRPFIDSLRKRAREAALEHVVFGLLKLIEDVANYIINSMHQTSAGRTKDGFSYTRESHRIGELLERLGDLKEQFDRGVGVQVLNQVLSTEQRALINQLKPNISFLNIMPSPCHEGTRTGVITDIRAWYLDTNNPQKLLWLYGQAGMGKSSIAASICQVFHDAGTLGAHFFFRRDDPHLRSPEHMLNFTVHRLALRYEPYGRAVAAAIESYSGLLDMPLGQRYVHLVEHPLQSLVPTGESPSKTFVVIVDALDECENTDSRRSLFSYLRKMSQLVPWIKILITSRPDEDIEAAFDSTNYDHVASRNLTSYDTSSDILIYTRMRMADMANRKKRSQWPEDLVRELSMRAAGLFIWVETACKFIERGADMRKRLEQVLAGSQPTEGTAPLDLLYTTAIKHAMGDEGPDNVQIFRECIGVIVATGSHKPLPITGLESLLSDHVGAGVFHTVVSGLGSVLYEDARQGGAIRVYHPSFADFILDPCRSGSFYTNPCDQNTVLAEYSLRTIMRELRFNICGLETSHILNRDIMNLETRVQAAIRPHLAYSCLYWFNHLSKTPEGTLQDQLKDFLHGEQLLYWIEAMSLLGKTNAALSSLLGLISWSSDAMKDHSSCAHDAYRFILTFYDAISQSTPHLYISALPSAPTLSKLAQRIRPLFPNTFVAALNMNQRWPNWLQSLPHKDAVISVACSVNGRQIVSGCKDGTVRIWDSETGAALSDPLNSPGVSHVAISSNGQWISSGSHDGTLRVWDAGTGAELAGPFQSRPRLLSLAFSSNCSKLFSVSSSGAVLAWDISTRSQLSELLVVHDDTIDSAAISPDEQLVAACDSGGPIRIWDTNTGNPLTERPLGHSASVYCVAFSPNCRIIATGADDSIVRIWEVNTASAPCHLMAGHSGAVLSVAFSPNGRYVVSGSRDRTVRVWDVETGMPVCDPLLGHTIAVSSVGFCSNSQRAVSASYDRTVLIWNVGAGVTAAKPPAGHTHHVNSVAFSLDGLYVASGSEDQTVRVWDTQNGDEVCPSFTSPSGAVQFVAFVPNSRRILSFAGHQTVQIHDMETGTLAVSFVLSGLDDILSIALSPNGQRLASGSKDGRVKLWDVEARAAVFVPVAIHSDWVRAVVFSPDGFFVASGSDDSTVRIWEAETGAALCEPLISNSGPVLSVCFSSNSRRIAFGTRSGTVQVWDIDTSLVLFEMLHGHERGVCSVAFTSNGRYIISGSADVTVRIWDAETGNTVAERLKGHSADVASIALSPDGRLIATGSWDSTVRIWDMCGLRTHDQLVIENLFTTPATRSVSTSVLAHYANKSGWVTSSTAALLFWLPKQRQRVDDSLIQISVAPTPNHVVIDFSKFVHGDSWTSVTGG